MLSSTCATNGIFKGVVMRLIELRDVSKSFTLASGLDLKVLQDVNVSIDAEEVIAILGPSGSGKSTCLRVMCGLEKPSEGAVLSRGVLLEGVNLDVALVFQSFALFPWETVYRNIALALHPMHLPAEEVSLRVKRAIDLVGLEGFEEAYPRELSGGMKQRVGIARAIVMDRPILFLDEPFSALDVLTADALRAEMVDLFLHQQTKVRSLVIVTHNIQEAVFMAKRILVMGTHPGHIRQDIVNDLPYPRQEQSPAFRSMVEQIHTLITETLMPDAAVPLKHVTREPPIESLPAIQIGEMIGLLECIADDGGFADIFDLAHQAAKDYGRTLYLVKAAELLRLVDTPKQDVVLTEIGKTFVVGDINVRKKMLHELFGSLRIVRMLVNLLDKDELLRLSVDTLTERVAEWLPNENPNQIVDTLISWGRFAEFLGYNDDVREVYLDVGQDF